MREVLGKGQKDREDIGNMQRGGLRKGSRQKKKEVNM